MIESISVPTRPAGDSGLELSVYGVGCWSFGGGDYWGPTDQETADTIVRRALELGINYFDTAEAYNGGRSEESLGRAIRGFPREDVVIGSKVGPGNAYAGTLEKHCEASLRRLGTEYIDVYMLHWPLNRQSILSFPGDSSRADSPPSVEEVAEGLLKLKDQGKIRHIGVSNFSVGWLERMVEAGAKPAVNQVGYNLFSRAIEYELIPYSRETGIGIIGYSVLLQGVLADRYPKLETVPPLYARTRHFSSSRSEHIRHGGPGAEAEMQEALAEVRAIAEELGRPMSEVAIAWSVHDPAVTCVIAGSRSTKRLEENARGAAQPLPEDALRRLDQATRVLKEKLGPSLDLWESPEKDRTI